MITNIMTRRTFGAGCLGAVVAASRLGEAAFRRSTRRTVDIHVHVFGVGHGGTGCRVSDTVRRSTTFGILTRTLGIHDAEDLDAAYVARLVEDAKGSGLDRVVVLAQDAAYAVDGTIDDANTHFFVPNDHVFAVCRREPGLLVPCVSINPARRDAVAELERCVERGARVLKIHPPTQGVDIADRRHRPFFAACANHDVLVMVHTGHEHSAPVVDIDLANPKRLEQALAAGCRVVACHAGSGRTDDAPDFLPGFVEMVRRHENLWGDTSILCTPGRERDLFRLLDDAAARGRLVHGSDYPFPSFPNLYMDTLGRRRAFGLLKERNLLRRDVRLKMELGLGDSVDRAGRLLLG